MGNSVVDLGAAGEYISEKFDDFVDYFTGAPEARASNTYIVKKSRKGQTLYSGENPEGRRYAPPPHILRLRRGLCCWPAAKRGGLAREQGINVLVFGKVGRSAAGRVAR